MGRFMSSMNLLSTLTLAVLAMTSPSPHATAPPNPCATGSRYVCAPTHVDWYPIVKNPVYFMYTVPKNGPFQYLRGYIAEYGLENEHESKYPQAFFDLLNGTHFTQNIRIAEPLLINGKPYRCQGGANEFERRFHVCPALPATVMGPNHPVVIKVFRALDPDGNRPVFATAEIDSLPQHP